MKQIDKELDQLYELFGTLLVSLPEIAEMLESSYNSHAESMHLFRAHQEMSQLMKSFDVISNHLIAYRKGDIGQPERKTWAQMYPKAKAHA